MLSQSSRTTRRRGDRNLLEQPEWARYARWNRAVADVVFSEEQAGLPVYLDLEDDVIARMAEMVGEVVGDPAENLVSAVAATVDRHGGASRLFINHRALVQQWERSEQVDHPPHLAFLAVLSLAAERMAEGDGMASNNYYGRLAPLLKLKHRRDDLAQAYREVAEQWWAALNKWLENHDGRRGLPTAYSLGQQQVRYVGLPISQALVRAADRAGLVHFFQRVGFAPGTDTAPSTLLPLLDAWIGLNPSPASKSLQRMWSKPSTRDRVAEVAAVALAAWDGTVRMGAGEARSLESLRLTATIGGFLRPRLEVGVLAYLQEPDEARDVVVTTTTAAAPRVSAVPFAAGAMRLAGMDEVDLSSLLDGVLTVSDLRTGRLVSRRPRRLVPLRQNDLLQVLVETDQVQAGEDLVVLVDRALLPSLTSLLSEIARPGWVVVEDLRGTPDRWAVVRDVQVLKGPAGDPPADLRSLVPLTRTSLVLSGGFALPGRLRRWHSSLPPEIRALDDEGRALCVRLTSLAHELDDASEAVERQWVSSTPGALVVDLGEADLADGDYRVELYRVTEPDPATSLVLRLRSADVPDRLQWERVTPLGHRPDLAISTLTAVPASDDGPWVRGAVSPRWKRREADNESAEAIHAVPTWDDTSDDTKKGRSWELALPDSGSCMFTGSHRFELPDDRGGRPTSPYIPVACTGCGIVKRMATTAWAARRRDQGRPSVPQLDVRALPVVRAGRADLWELALDALGYFGGGEWGLLEKVALQVEASALFVDQFVRTLEALGHIEVERDRTTLEPVRWEIAPTSLVGAARGRWYLVGFWPGSAVADLQEVVEEHDGGIYEDDDPDGLSSSFVEMPPGVSLPDLTGLSGLAVLPDAARRLATALSDLSLVVQGLPRRSADLMGEIKMFSPSSARWVQASDLSQPGAYRVQRWATTDVIRTDADLQDGTVARSTVQLSKHAAAQEQGLLLMAYDPRTRDLSVPLGADLPGLYGRAATLASGLAPVADRTKRRLVYTDVPPDLAAVLAHRLSH